MQKITRRKALKIGGITAFAALSLPGCCCLREFLHIPCDPIKKWKDENSVWWRNQKKQREVQRKKEIDDGKRPDVELPKPYLDIGRIAGPHDWPIYQVRNFHLNEWRDLFVVVRNNGNAATWTCIVGSGSPDQTRMYHSRGRRIGNAIDFAKFLIGLSADPSRQQFDFLAVDWNLDSDRGYGYKNWSGIGDYLDPRERRVRFEAYV